MSHGPSTRCSKYAAPDAEWMFEGTLRGRDELSSATMAGPRSTSRSAVPHGVAPARCENERRGLAGGIRRQRPRAVRGAGWRTGEVLTLAYMNEEALARTRESGEVWFWSRSRQELWHKGETSGNVHARARAALRLRRRRRAGARRARGPGLPHRRAHLLPQRRPRRPRRTRRCRRSSARSRTQGATASRSGSYTAELLADPPRIGAKVQEEAEEVARAAREETDERVAEEAADVLYHLTVLLASRGLSWPTPSRSSMAVAADRPSSRSPRASTRCASSRATTRSCRCATPSSPTSRRRSPPT